MAFTMSSFLEVAFI